MMAESDKSNVAEPIPLRRDLMIAYRRQSVIGWVVAGALLFLNVGLSLYIALNPAPLKGVDEYGRVVGQVIFDEPRIRGADEILGDMKNLVRRCLTTSKQTVWEDISICLSHMNQTIQDSLMENYEQTGDLLRIEAYGCDRVDFNFIESETGLIELKRGDYFAEGLFSGSVSCLDNAARPGTQDFKMRVAVILRPKTENRPLGLEVIQYDEI